MRKKKPGLRRRCVTFCAHCEASLHDGDVEDGGDAFASHLLAAHPEKVTEETRRRLCARAEKADCVLSSGVRDSIVGMVETMIEDIDKDLAFMREVQEDIKSRGLPPEDDSFGH